MPQLRQLSKHATFPSLFVKGDILLTFFHYLLVFVNSNFAHFCLASVMLTYFSSAYVLHFRNKYVENGLIWYPKVMMYTLFEF